MIAFMCGVQNRLSSKTAGEWLPGLGWDGPVGTRDHLGMVKMSCHWPVVMAAQLRIYSKSLAYTLKIR